MDEIEELEDNDEIQENDDIEKISAVLHEQWKEWALELMKKEVPKRLKVKN